MPAANEDVRALRRIDRLPVELERERPVEDVEPLVRAVVNVHGRRRRAPRSHPLEQGIGLVGPGVHEPDGDRSELELVH